jgi:hypothetical protein
MNRPPKVKNHIHTKQSHETYVKKEINVFIHSQYFLCNLQQNISENLTGTLKKFLKLS